MSGFQQDIGGPAQVPNLPAPSKDYVLEGLTSLGSIAQNVFSGVAENKKQAAIAAQNERVASITSKAASYKLQLLEDNPKITASQIDEKINDYIRRNGAASSVELLAIREQMASEEFGGSFVGMRIDEERAKLKEFETYANGLARTWGPYASAAEAIATEGEGIIEEYERKQFELEKFNRDHDRAIKTLERETKTIDRDNAVAQLKADKAIGNLQIEQDIEISRVVSTAYVFAKENNIDVNSDEFSRLLINELDKAQAQFTQTVGAIHRSISDPLARDKFGEQTKALAESWDTVAKPIINYYMQTGVGDFDEERINQIRQNATLSLIENPENAFVGALVKEGFVDAATLQGYTKGLFGNQIKQIPGNIREGYNAIKFDPTGTKPALDKLLINSVDEPAPNGGLIERPNPALAPAATAIKNTISEVLKGNVRDVPKSQQEMLFDQVSLTMKKAIRNPETAGIFSPEVTSLITDTVLSPEYNKMPEDQKAAIADDISDYAGAFFGGVASGNFAPQVMAAWEQVGKELRGLGMVDIPMFELGVNQETGLLQVAIAGEGSIGSAQSVYPFTGATRQGQQRMPSKVDPDKVLKARNILREFKKGIESDPQVNAVLRATAAAKGIPLESVTGSIVAMLSKSSDIPVNEAFIDQPETPKEEKELPEVSNLMERIEELEKQNELLLSMTPEEYAEFKNA